VTDHFAVLGFPQRPGLDPAALKQAYLDLAARLHPDSAQGDDTRFSELQEAHRVLTQPALRLRHLLALSFPDVVASEGGLPKNSAHLFDLGAALQRAKNALAQRAKATTALGRAVAAQELAAASQALRAAHAPLAAAESATLQELAALDKRWPAVSAEELTALAREFTFLNRWKGEVAEYEFQLANS